MKYLKPISYLFLCIVLFSCGSGNENTIDLAGDWQFKIDSLDRGVSDKWYADDLPGTIKLPGSMAENGLGNDVTVDTKWTGSLWNDSLWYKSPKYEKYRQPGNVKISFWLTPKKKYTGAAWYQKKVTIPEVWKDKHITLNLERAHCWETILWVDSTNVGMKNTLGTPHDYAVNNLLTPGDHILTLCIDNRVKDIDPGVDAHSITDNTQTNWNGLVGDIELRAEPKIFIENVRLYPDVKNNQLLAVVKVKNTTGKPQQAKLSLFAKASGASSENLGVTDKEMTVDTTGTYPMGENPLLWDEFHPSLYTMEVRLNSKAGENMQEQTFGMRDFKVDGKGFSVNGRPIFLRGTLECAIFPLTGYPPTDKESWTRILKIIKAHGLNHMRFHSWCPPEAAFDAADELGVYLQIEASAWAKIGDGKPIDKWIYEEATDILDTYGSHPSFVMMAYGNEPSGDNQNAYLTKFVDHFKKYDDSKVYTSGSGWPFLDNMDYYVNSKPRIQQWAQGLNSIINSSYAKI